MRVKLPSGGTAHVSKDVRPETLEALDQMCRAAAKAPAARITAQDLMQLTSLGIPAYKRLAEAIGKTVTETRRLVEQGALDNNPHALQAFEAMMVESIPF